MIKAYPVVPPKQFAELKAAFFRAQPNGSAEIVAFPGNPNGSPNGSGPQGPKPGRRQRFAKEEALSDLKGRLDRGERFGSQDELKARYGVAKSTMSDWLREWERDGSIPPRPARRSDGASLSPTHRNRFNSGKPALGASQRRGLFYFL